MNIEYKTIEATIKQAGDDGTFEAVIATFGEIDKDGDIVEHGAFKNATVSVLPAHDSMSVPLGKAQIEERGELAVAVGRFNLEIEAARDWSAALKFDLENPPAVQEWSWGFRPLEAPTDTVDGVTVRRLKLVDNLEVSPVLRGASIGTRTISAKNEDGEESPTLLDQVSATSEDVKSLIAEIREVSKGRMDRGRRLSPAVSVAAMDLAGQCQELDRVLRQFKCMAEHLLPEDAVAKAAANFLAHETLRHRIGV
jgi:hypothetical protein